MPTWLSDCTGICEGWYRKEKKIGRRLVSWQAWIHVPLMYTRTIRGHQLAKKKKKGKKEGIENK